MDKVVFSSTLDEPLIWPNTRLVRENAVDAVGQMKQHGDRSLRTVGSLSLCRSLLSAGLVDRLRVVIFPVITGASGREAFYTGWPDVARTLDGRLQLMEYVPRILEAPPS